MSARAGRMWRALAVLVLGAAGASCGEGNTGPDVPVAIEFHQPQLPSLLVGDSLRDTLGNVDSLRAIVFNSAGDTIHDAPLRYLPTDTTHFVNVDSISGKAFGVDTGVQLFVAQTSALQSPPDTLFVVQPPDLFAAVTPLESTLDFTSVRTDTVFPLTVHLTSTGSSGPSGVGHFRIEYRFTSPADLNTPDTTRVLLVDDSRKFSLVDTTASDGTATRSLRISPFAHTFNDTVVVEARAFLPNRTPVSGSPLRFKVFVHIP